MASPIRKTFIVSLFMLLACMSATKIKVGQYYLTYLPTASKPALIGQIPYLGPCLGLIGSCTWNVLHISNGTVLFCDSYNYTCLGLNKAPNTILLKLQNLADISQQWTINNATLQLTNGAVSNNLCAAAKLVDLLGNPVLSSPLNMQPCASPSEQFTIA